MPEQFYFVADLGKAQAPKHPDWTAKEPFESFTCSPAGAAVYQLGPFGTAAKKLKECDLKP